MGCFPGPYQLASITIHQCTTIASLTGSTQGRGVGALKEPEIHVTGRGRILGFHVSYSTRRGTPNSPEKNTGSGTEGSQRNDVLSLKTLRQLS